MQEALVSSMAIHQRKHNYNFIKSYPQLYLRHTLITPKTHTQLPIPSASPTCYTTAGEPGFLRHTCTGTSPFTFALGSFEKGRNKLSN